LNRDEEKRKEKKRRKARKEKREKAHLHIPKKTESGSETSTF
jgi:hypothetical protein